MPVARLLRELRERRRSLKRILDLVLVRPWRRLGGGGARAIPRFGEFVPLLDRPRSLRGPPARRCHRRWIWQAFRKRALGYSTSAAAAAIDKRRRQCSRKNPIMNERAMEIVRGNFGKKIISRRENEEAQIEGGGECAVGS